MALNKATAGLIKEFMDAAGILDNFEEELNATASEIGNDDALVWAKNIDKLVLQVNTYLPPRDKIKGKPGQFEKRAAKFIKECEEWEDDT